MVDYYMKTILDGQDCVPFWTHGIYDGNGDDSSCNYDVLLNQYLVATEGIFAVKGKCVSK